MLKRGIVACGATFLVWSVLDFVIHGVLLKDEYQATLHLWRGEEHVKLLLLSFVTLVFSICFVAIYGLLIKGRSVATGIKFGVLLGVASGVSMGFGSYSYMPIPLSLAWSWAVGTFFEIVVAGALVGAIMRPDR